MATFNTYNIFMKDLVDGVHDFESDTIKAYLSNTAPTASDTIKGTGSATEISAGSGYTAGGDDAQATTATITTNDASITFTDITWTASGGTIGPFRYVVLYNDDTADKTDPLIGWYDYGSSITLNDTETFTTDFAAPSATVSI